MNVQKNQRQTAEAAVLNTSLPRAPLGFSAGDYYEAADREVRRFLKEAEGDPLQAVKLALKRLHETERITDYDLDCLNEITDCVAALRRGQRDSGTAATDLGDIYYTMLADPRSSDAVTSTVGILFAAARPGFEERAGVGALTGAIIGLYVGIALGNPFAGASIGGIIGGIVGGCTAEE